LRQLPKSTDPNLLVSSDSHSDSGAYRLRDDLAILQTVDFFAPLTNDPYVFGQIAAANSLSDVYAMGGAPTSALNIVAFPDDQLPLSILNEILRGGVEKAHEAGASVLGGHTIRDKEIKYGMAVTGVAHPEHLVINSGAKPGDVLMLTKPIGTGAMTAAYQKNKISDAIWNNCCDTMARLNRAAAEAMVKAGAHAATDITGFGLLGHASEMAEASSVTLEIEATAVPLLEGAMALSKAGFITRAAATNGTYVAERLTVQKEPEKALYNLIIDAQTSGGLLIALPEASLGAFKKAYTEAAPDETWTTIGRVRERGETAIVLA
jgi:selenide,water dikinase